MKVAGKFESDVKIYKDGLEVNGKSIMGVMMLAAESGSEIELVVDGPDEQEAFKAIVELFKNNFYEDQN